MLNINSSRLPPANAPTSEDQSSEFDVSRLLSAVKRERWKVVAWMAALLLLAVVYLLFATPLFKAENDVIIDPTTSATLEKSDINTAEAPAVTDTSLVDSEVEILTSDGLARDTIKKLHLDADPEFIGPKPGVLGWIDGRIGAVMKMIFPDQGPDDPMQRAAEAFSHKLVVKRTALTYVITITFWAETPQKAAMIANGVADVYLQSVLDGKYIATKQTAQWVEGGLAELRARANEAARAVETYKSQNNIVDTNRGLMNEQQLGELNSQLALASAATAEAGARLATAREVLKDPLSGHTTTEALNNDVLSRLRAQYLDLESRAGDLAKRLGSEHGTVVNLRNQMNEIRKAALEQLNQVVAADANDFSVAKSREDSLRKSIAQLVTANDQTGLAQVKLKDLEGTAESLQTIYTTYLQKYQELIQRSSFPISDARVISPAVPPQKKSSPKTLLIVAGALVFGGFIGVGHVLAREMMADTYVFADDIQHETGIRCLGVLPALTGRRKRGKPTTEEVENCVNRFPNSRFAETLRAVKVELDSRKTSKRGRVVGVTSAVPGEGKTSVALNLARLLVSSGGKTLLIDGDLTRRGVSQRAAPEATSGLIEVVEGRQVFTQVLQAGNVFDPDILPCGGKLLSKQRTEILQSKAFADLIGRARETYDYVVIDIAPVVPVVDAKIISALVDGFIMVVEWRATSKKVVAEALETEEIRAHTLGIVLNKANSKVLESIESYRGRAALGYYS